MNDLAVMNKQFEYESIEKRFSIISSRFKGNIMITTSGGKNSSVLLHLVKKYLPLDNVFIVFVDTGYYPQSTYKTIQHYINEGLPISIYSSSMTPNFFESIYGSPYALNSKDFELFQSIIKHEPLNRAINKINSSIWINGAKRFDTNKREQMNFFEEKNGIIQVHPILDWSEEEIRKLIKDNNLYTNSEHYDITKEINEHKECNILYRCGKKKL